MSEHPPTGPGDDRDREAERSSAPPPPGPTTPPPGAPPPPPPAGAPSGPGQPTAPATGQEVSVGQRIGARLIDFVLLWIVTLVIVVPLFIGALFTDAGMGGGFGFGSSAGGIISSIISYAIYIAYFAFLESSRGQTLGKQLLGIRVVGPDGGNPTMEQALKRNAWLALGIIPWIGGLLTLGAAIWIIVTIANEQQRAVHDQFAGGTRVVKA